MSKPPLISFDYAIKYLLKDKGDYSIIENFISALLKNQGYKEVKIIALLDTESNKEDPDSKQSRADIIVEDQDHNKYVVEIERSFKSSFIHKACFNTSRLIVDNLKANSDYSNIIKVFHVTLLYFSTGNKGSLYHGKTIIQETETKENLTMRMKKKGYKGALYEPADILPEYFVISIPGFDDSVKKEIDQWLYVMKHEEVRSDFTSPAMKQVAEKLSILKMTDEERTQYYSYRKMVCDTKEETPAVAEARAEGKAEGKMEIALSMLKHSVDIVLISKYTGLSFEEIERLKKEK